MKLPKIKYSLNRLLPFPQNKDLIDWTIIIFLLALSFLFYYKLGQSSLISWDEAWYADIGRTLSEKGNLLKLTWNGKSFLDHPPFGFWVIALSFKIFGVSEFWARFPSATFAFLTLVFVYFLGKKLFNRQVGLLSSIALLSGHWFLYRARSANLDIFLTCLFVSSIYFFIKLQDDKRFLIPSILSLIFLFLTKTLIPFTILPVLLFMILTAEKKVKGRLMVSVGIALGLFGLWFLYNHLNNREFLSRFISIGAPGVSIETNYFENIKLTKKYIYEGLGKWFWPSIASLFLSTFLFQKRFYILSIFFVSFSLPFIFSLRGHIWHLIPLHPFMLLSLVGFSYIFFKKFLKREVLVFTVLALIIFYQSAVQTKRNWNEFIGVNAFTSDEEILSREAGKIDANFYIDSDFGPAAVFYSRKNVQQFSDPSLRSLFDKKEKFSLITFQWRIDRSGIKETEYEIKARDRDKILIVRK